MRRRAEKSSASFPHWRVEGGAPRGRRGYPRAHFEEVAAVYKAADGVKPTLAVRDYWTREKKWPITKSTAAKWVSRARDLELLPKHPGRGRPTRRRIDE